jgi:hypothetical protein
MVSTFPGKYRASAPPESASEFTSCHYSGRTFGIVSASRDRRCCHVRPFCGPFPTPGFSPPDGHLLRNLLALRWFNHHLPFPNRFSRSGRRDACGKGICWFRDSAARYIREVRELAVMLEKHGVAVEMLRTSKPGYIVYEDSYQIVAVPFRETRA